MISHQAFSISSPVSFLLTPSQHFFFFLQKKNFHSGAIYTKNVLAVAYRIQGKMELTFQTFKEAIQLAEATNNQIHVCRTYTNIGRTYIKIGNFEQAVDFYQKGVKCPEHFGQKQQMHIGKLTLLLAKFIRNLAH